MATICVTGATGYIGSRLIPLLAKRGHRLKVVARPGSENKIRDNVAVVSADPLKERSYTESIRGCDTFIHLIGVPHPSPAKAAQFRAIDLPSIQVAVKAAHDAGVRHFIYLSVAQPASMMQAFVAVRAEGEALIRASGMKATFVRPWYVLGPGPLVALRPSSVLQNRRTASADARIGKASWAHHDFANAPRSRLVGRESG